MTEGRRIVAEYDKKYAETKDEKLLAEANEKLCGMAKSETVKCLNAVLFESSKDMKNGFNMSDN